MTEYIDLPAGKLASVITHFEMLSPVPPRPDEPLASWEISHETEMDIDRYRRLFYRIGRDYLWYARLELSDDALRAILHHPLVNVVVLKDEGIDKGLLELDFRKKDACEISYFGMTEDLFGKKASRLLMNHALRRAWSHPIKRFWLHTCTFDHPAALSFYLRSGFTVFRRQVEIIDDPRISGILPKDAAPKIPMLRFTGNPLQTPSNAPWRRPPD